MRCSAKHLVLVLFVVLAAGCRSAKAPPLMAMANGEYGRARALLAKRIGDESDKSNYLLNRMRLAIVLMADGYPGASQLLFEDIYEVLRTQGINKDKTVASVIIHEGVRTWKGEPFEQALGFLYYSAQQASLGQWDNARAAANNSLFNLRDFGVDEDGKRLDVEAIARRAIEHERAASGSAQNDADDFINSGYAVRESNFTLGYIMAGLANQQLGREQEANDHFAVAAEIDPGIRPLMQELRDGRYNTILLVSYGLGPAKVAYGDDGERVRFEPRFRSDRAPLIVRFTGDPRRHLYPVITDVNAMAADHMWNSLENVRIAKSAIGSVLLGGGALAAYAGAAGDSDEALYAGLGAMALGMLLKAGSSADVRYLELLPQRYYIVPLTITAPGSQVELQVEPEPGSRLVLAGLSPPAPGEPAQFRYVRLVHGTPYPPPWAVSGEIHYGNDRTGALPAPGPYILGGNDLRTPNEQVLSEYQQSGYLEHFTLNELRDLYFAEKLHWEERPRIGLHVLEGGRSLVSPLTGTTGFARLFGQLQRDYRPRSPRVRELSKTQPLHEEAP